MDQWVTPSILSMSSPPYRYPAQPDYTAARPWTRAGPEGNAASKRRPGGEVVLDDLAPGRAPHTLVAQDVGECRGERADPVRYTNDEWMSTGRHNASRLRALAAGR